MMFICLGGVVINTGELIECNINEDEDFCHSRSQWPRGLRHGPAAPLFLGFRFRIPPRACLSVCCHCVFSGGGLCERPISRTEEPYQVRR